MTERVSVRIVRFMAVGRALDRLPHGYGAALQMAADGRGLEAIASELRVEPHAVRPMIEIAAVKLTRLLEEDVSEGQSTPALIDDSVRIARGRVDRELERAGSSLRRACFADAHTRFRRAWRVADGSDDANSKAKVAVAAADAVRRCPAGVRRTGELRRWLEDAAQEVGPASPLASRILAARVMVNALASDATTARELARQVSIPATGEAAATTTHDTVIAHRWGAPPGAGATDLRGLTEHLVLDALQSDDAEAEWFAQRWRLRDALEVGEPDVVNTSITRLVELGDDLAHRDLQIDATLRAATVALAEGRFDQMVECHRQVEALTGEPPQEIMAWQRVCRGVATGHVDVEDVNLVRRSVPPSVRVALDPWVASFAVEEAGPSPLAAGVLSELLPDDIPDDHGHLLALCMLARATVEFDDTPVATWLADQLRDYRDLCAVDGGPPVVWLGSVELYRAMVALVLEDVAEAEDLLDAADAIHTRMGARALLVEGERLRGLVDGRRGDRRGRREHLERARTTATVLGMEQMVSVCDRALSMDGRMIPPAGSERVWSLRRDGGSWHLATASVDCHLPDRKGLSYLDCLLRSPGVEVHVLDLVTGGAAPFDGGVGPILDRRAKDEYRRRVEDLRDQIADGERWGDDERVARAEQELDHIAHELAAATGLNGRDRPSDAGERARVSVRKALRSVLATLDDVAPEVGDHLGATIRTGYYCTYVPDPACPVKWRW